MGVSKDSAIIVDTVIRQRQTSKVLGDVSQPVVVDSDFQHVVNQIVEVAGHAPFHYSAHNIHLNGHKQSLVPWRFYVLHNDVCRQLLVALKDKPAGKILPMLAAAGTLIMVTWLPDPDENDAGGLSPRNIEHIAAASCATQNLLLAATARKIENYWSSGGILRTAEVYEICGIPAQEAFLGAIFLYPAVPAGADVRRGKMRDKRGEVGDWVTAVSLKCASIK